MFPDRLPTGHVLRHVPDVAGTECCTRLQDRNTAHISRVSLLKHGGNKKAFQSMASRPLADRCMHNEQVHGGWQGEGWHSGGPK